MKKLVIYSPSTSNKLNYVIKFIFKEQLGLHYTIVDELANFKASPAQLKISYSSELIPNSISIKSTAYFSNFELTAIPDFEKMLGLGDKEFSSFDLFAATFFLLARVEEYGKAQRDEHDRYRSQDSVLVKKELIAYPLIDSWILELKVELERRLGSGLEKNNYKFSSTIDVDHIYAYKGKAAGVTVGAFIKDFVRLKWGRLMDRLRSKDPYDRFSDILAWHKVQRISPLFFILTTERGKYDKSHAPHSTHFRQQIKKLSSEVEVGIHPSYQSYGKVTKMRAERATLSELVESEIDKSRQHFLRLSLPNTYRDLIAAGITEDFSMGYPDVLGFRAGTSLAFQWYDLLEDRETSLKVFPFQIMDVTLKKYLGYDPDKAIASSWEIIKAIKDVDGHCSIIWHNSSFYEREGWEGWEAVYKEILRIASA